MAKEINHLINVALPDDLHVMLKDAVESEVPENTSAELRMSVRENIVAQALRLFFAQQAEEVITPRATKETHFFISDTGPETPTAYGMCCEVRFYWLHRVFLKSYMKKWRYVGKGRICSVNGVSQSFSQKHYFWVRK